MCQVKVAYAEKFGGHPTLPLPELCSRCTVLLLLLGCDASKSTIGTWPWREDRLLQGIIKLWWEWIPPISSARVVPVHNYNLHTPSATSLPPPPSLPGFWICHVHPWDFCSWFSFVKVWKQLQVPAKLSLICDISGSYQLWSFTRSPSNYKFCCWRTYSLLHYEKAINNQLSKVLLGH